MSHENDVDVDPAELASEPTNIESGEINITWQPEDTQIASDLGRYEDGFSLDHPSSYVTFHDRKVRIYSSAFSQMIIEKKNNNSVIVRETSDSTFGLFLLRAVYTLVSVLMSAFLLVFCIQLLLFLFLGLAIDSGLTSSEQDPLAFIGVILSVPYYVHALASIMTIATAFVIDTWYGQHFVKTLNTDRGVITEWTTFLLFLIVPLVTAVVVLFQGNDKWWQITAITWFLGIFLYYVVFAHLIVYFEINGCLELVRYHPRLRNKSLKEDSEYSWSVLKRAVLLRQKQKFSGVEELKIVMSGADKPLESLSYNEIKQNYRPSSSTGLWTKITNIPSLSCIFADSDPIRSYSIEEILDDSVFVTRNSWGLEKFFCRNRQRYAIGVISGPSAVSLSQAQSSFAASLLQSIGILVVFAALLTWFDLTPIFIGLIVLIMILSSIHAVWSIVSIFRSYLKSKKREKSSDSGADTLFRMTVSYRVNEAGDKFCLLMLLLEVAIFYILPIIILYETKNYPIAILFTVLGLYQVAREFVNCASCVKELGTLDGLEVNNKSSDPYETWKEKNRLSLILNHISQGRRARFWMIVFSVFVFLFLLVFMAAVVFGSNDGSTEEFKMIRDFYYEGNTGLPYPACQLGKGLQTPGGSASSLIDYVFLSNVAYQDSNTTQVALDNWFGQNFAIDQNDTVSTFKLKYEKENGPSAVHYKFITFPSSNSSVVTIRGTNNGWDALSDAQLWSSAALAQYVRFLLPLGDIWTPILFYLVKAVSVIEAKSLGKVAFYRQTTAFVQYLKTQGYSPSITGHSLGGGLAIITGSQTESPVVALSGPNAMISRLTFDPPVTVDALKKFTFNIVPDRDPVPRIDDLAGLYQRIKCRTNPNDPVGCHNALRSLCEVLYECGSASRATFCACTRTYKYPVPASRGNETFDDVCPLWK